jgi:hypothetical protein
VIKKTEDNKDLEDLMCEDNPIDENNKEEEYESTEVFMLRLHRGLVKI